jgi:hypothetical protein
MEATRVAKLVAKMVAQKGVRKAAEAATAAEAAEAVVVMEGVVMEVVEVMENSACTEQPGGPNRFDTNMILKVRATCNSHYLCAYSSSRGRSWPCTS